jgi:hypothetical protein
MSRPAGTLPWPGVGADVDLLAVRRAALWTLLASKLTAGWGVGWDIRWHLLIGRDSFWIPPHVLTYASLTVATIVALGVVAVETWMSRSGPVPAGSIRLLRLVGTPGFHLSWLGTALMLLAAPIDNLWHRLFGIDVTLWSPPHLLGLLGAQVNTLACLLIAREVWPAGSRARLIALLLGATFLFGTFAISADPSFRIAFLYGGLWYFTWAVLAGLLFGFTLVLATRLTGMRWAALAIAVLALLFQLSSNAVGDMGFALARPTSSIQEVLAADDGTSPIAVAHEMARRNGTAVGGGSSRARTFPILGAVLLVALDARRRPVAAALAFGIGLLAVSFPLMLRSPALAHVRPDTLTTAIGVALSLASTAAGGWLAARLANRIAPR